MSMSIFGKYLLRGAAVLACALMAWMATLVRWNPARAYTPIIVLVIVLAFGLLFGRTVGILGSIVGALVFARSLAPIGSLRVQDQGARSAVAWMLLAGVTLSYLLLPSHHDHTPGS